MGTIHAIALSICLALATLTSFSSQQQGINDSTECRKQTLSDIDGQPSLHAPALNNAHPVGPTVTNGAQPTTATVLDAQLHQPSTSATVTLESGRPNRLIPQKPSSYFANDARFHNSELRVSDVADPVGTQQDDEPAREKELSTVGLVPPRMRGIPLGALGLELSGAKPIRAGKNLLGAHRQGAYPAWPTTSST